MGAAERQRIVLRRLDLDPRTSRRGGLRRDARGDEGAGAGGRHREAVGDQPLIGRGDGVTAEAGLPGQRTRRRQRLARLDQAADDRAAQRLIQPLLRGRARRHVGVGEVERQVGLAGRRLAQIGRNFSHGIGTIADQIGRYNS